MALPARFSLLHSDLNDFLFASIAEEQNGVTLSVVSALTRLGVDPWAEAARLMPLPKARAAEALATLIARLPIRRTQSLGRSFCRHKKRRLCSVGDAQGRGKRNIGGR
jgi:hypothetical protein